VTSDMGAIDPGSWHDWHLAWKMGATSLVKVTVRSGAAAVADPDSASHPAAARTAMPTRRVRATISTLLFRADSKRVPARPGLPQGRTRVA
jgi:hypothetical protein